MARWEAHTMFKPFGAGAVVNLLEVPQFAGHLSKPAVGERLSLVDTDDKWTEGQFTHVTPSTMEAAMANGKTLSLRPLRAGELGSSIRTQGMYSEDWAVSKYE